MWQVRPSTVFTILFTPIGLYVVALSVAAVLSVKPNLSSPDVAVRVVGDGDALLFQAAHKARGFYTLYSLKIAGNFTTPIYTHVPWRESNSRWARGLPIPPAADESLQLFVFPSVFPLLIATLYDTQAAPMRRVGFLDLSSIAGQRLSNGIWVPAGPVISNILIAWLPVAAGLLGIRFLYERWRRERAGARGVCVACGYALGALQKCPECGHARAVQLPSTT